MPEALQISQEQAAQLLRLLRPVDLGVALQVYRGSPFAERPTLEELSSGEAQLFWLAAWVSYAQSESHSGLVLDNSLQAQAFFSNQEDQSGVLDLRLVDVVGTVDSLLSQFPDKVVLASSAGSCLDAPFVVRREASLVYFHRWFALEAELGSRIRVRLSRKPRQLPKGFPATFGQFFPLAEVQQNPWQAVACFSALLNDFSVVTGGPGTGKTTTITRLIALLLSLPDEARPKDIRLIAPTGKATDRMRLSFGHNLQEVLQVLPEAEAALLADRARLGVGGASTIHALLGSRGLKGFQHHAGNPLSCDVLIVDEATMVDLELFVALFRALPDACRVVVLGDKNQLTAVETGNVFADLTTVQSGPLNAFSKSFRNAFASMAGYELTSLGEALPVCGDHVTELIQSYRFTGGSEVGQLARLLLEEQRLPAAGEFPNMLTLEDNWERMLLGTTGHYAERVRDGSEPQLVLEELNRSRILCAVRAGPEGVDAVNALLCERIFGSGIRSGAPVHGLPFMIVRNDRTLGLWNGDCGVFLADTDGAMAAYLPGENAGSIRKLDPYALPEWEVAFALTIHKSQGSEYGSVVVVLPETRRPILTWELVYTGITRARDRVSLVMPRACLGLELQHVRRVSGLLLEIEAPDLILNEA